MELTPEEEKLFNYLRRVAGRYVEWGRISLIIYVQNGKLLRAETKEVPDIPEVVGGEKFY